MRPVSSWGRLNADLHDVVNLRDPDAAASVLAERRPGVALGMARSYGDVCLNPGGILWSTKGLDHFVHFDEQLGLLRCEAGVLVRDIQRIAVTRGWMLAVTPGTQFVTVGGALANDVHGKNHHVQGSFGDHVRWLKLLRSDGEIIECGPAERADWFAATVGGMGLTGLVLEAELQLRRVTGPWMQAETVPYENLDEFFALADASEEEWEHTVSWIDCIGSREGRGLFMRANHAKAQARVEPRVRSMAMPVVPPMSLVNRLTLRPFNAAYFHLHKASTTVVHHEAFSYPLDNVQDWNRLYGPRGFYQYQSVVPRSVQRDASKAMLNEITRSGEGSFLAVLKTFGNRLSPGMLSFPMPGATLALDFPNRGDRTLALFSRLDAIVREAGGRIYCAKDARMPRALFEAGYPRLAEFLPYRDPGISSGMSRRLMGS
ncbi:FAD/FMN-containing dehydrogenase [Variovorax paradoxus]|uniref:FAD/FMN-containing dehydrogenase n=1 Tax=Variovorax paradoxus TaxID=34073 RepID=A0AAE3XX07_VARPD|nr:FAD-binding oxidoreductase [Variovorax paradoxus]MDR6425667.1 FAD/FMN-containing dehydrogenase [Variovorax paradoxus]